MVESIHKGLRIEKGQILMYIEKAINLSRERGLYSYRWKKRGPYSSGHRPISLLGSTAARRGGGCRGS